MTTLILARVLAVIGCGVALFLLWDWYFFSPPGLVRDVTRAKFEEEAELRWREWWLNWTPDPRIPR